MQVDMWQWQERARNSLPPPSQGKARQAPTVQQHHHRRSPQVFPGCRTGDICLGFELQVSQVILVTFVSHAGSEHVHTREEDLAGRCWHDLSWRHEQPLRFICSRVPVSDTGLPAPGHCHLCGLCRLRRCKGTAAGRGQAPCPETPQYSLAACVLLTSPFHPYYPSSTLLSIFSPLKLQPFLAPGACPLA